jgi:hypothetical protein
MTPLNLKRQKNNDKTGSMIRELSLKERRTAQAAERGMRSNFRILLER